MCYIILAARIAIAKSWKMLIIGQPTRMPINNHSNLKRLGAHVFDTYQWICEICEVNCLFLLLPILALFYLLFPLFLFPAIAKLDLSGPYLSAYLYWEAKENIYKRTQNYVMEKKKKSDNDIPRIALYIFLNNVTIFVFRHYYL